MTRDFDVLIVGGGMVGAMLGCALGDSPFRVGVVEACYPQEFLPSQPYDLRVSAISRASQHMFEAVGAWQNMLAMRACPYRHMLVWDDEGRGQTHFDSADVGEPMLGHIIENRIVQLGLLQRLQTFDNVELLCPAGIEDLRRATDAAEVTLEDGRRLRASLVVGADGANSRVREMAGIAVRGWAYDQHALVASVRTRLPQQDITWQRFKPTGPEAFLPLPGHHASMVWYHTPEEVQRLLALEEGEFIAAMEAAFPERLGGIEQVVARGYFPLRRQHAEKYVLPRLALVGDAGHTIHPLAGQGVNLGLMDAAALAEVLLAAEGRQRDIGGLATLRRYERWRRGGNLVMQNTMEAFYRLFAPQPRPVRLVRNLGLELADRVTPLKHHVMRYAMGLSGDLPRLARGEGVQK